MEVALPYLGPEVTVRLDDDLLLPQIGATGRVLADGDFALAELLINDGGAGFVQTTRAPKRAQVLLESMAGRWRIGDGAIPILLTARSLKPLGIVDLVGAGTEVTGWLQEEGLWLPMYAAKLLPLPTSSVGKQVGAVLRRGDGGWEFRLEAGAAPQHERDHAPMIGLLSQILFRKAILLDATRMSFDWRPLGPRAWTATMSGSCTTSELVRLRPGRVSGSTNGITFMEGDRVDGTEQSVRIRAGRIDWPRDGIRMEVVPFSADRRIPVPDDAAAWLRTTAGWLRIDPDRDADTAWSRSAERESRSVDLDRLIGGKVGEAGVRLLMDHSGPKTLWIPGDDAPAETAVLDPVVAVECAASVRWLAATSADLPPADPPVLDTPGEYGEGGVLFVGLAASFRRPGTGSPCSATLVGDRDGPVIRLEGRRVVHWRAPSDELLYTPASWSVDAGPGFRTTSGLVPLAVDARLTALQGRWRVEEVEVRLRAPPDQERCYGVAEHRLGLEWDPGSSRAWWRSAVALLDLRWRATSIRAGTSVGVDATAVKRGVLVGPVKDVALDDLGGFPATLPSSERGIHFPPEVPSPRTIRFEVAGVEVARVALDEAAGVGLVEVDDAVSEGLRFEAVDIRWADGELVLELQAQIAASIEPSSTSVSQSSSRRQASGTLTLSGVPRRDVVETARFAGTLRIDALMLRVAPDAAITHFDLSRPGVTMVDGRPHLSFSDVRAVFGGVASRFVVGLAGCTVRASRSELVVEGTPHDGAVSWAHDGALEVSVKHSVAGVEIVETLTQAEDARFRFHVGDVWLDGQALQLMHRGVRLLLTTARRVDAAHHPVGPLLAVRALTRVFLELRRDASGHFLPFSGLIGWEIASLGALVVAASHTAHATLRFTNGSSELTLDGSLGWSRVDALFWRHSIPIGPGLRLDSVRTSAWVRVPLDGMTGISVVPSLNLEVDESGTALHGVFGVAREGPDTESGTASALPSLLVHRPSSWTSRRWIFGVQTTDASSGPIEALVSMRVSGAGELPASEGPRVGLGEGRPLGVAPASGTIDDRDVPVGVAEPGRVVTGELRAPRIDERLRALTLTSTGWRVSPVLGWNASDVMATAMVRVWILGPTGFTLLVERSRPDSPDGVEVLVRWARRVLADNGWLLEAVLEVPRADPGDVDWIAVDSPLLNPTVGLDALAPLAVAHPRPPLPRPAENVPSRALKIGVQAEDQRPSIRPMSTLTVTGPNDAVQRILRVQQEVEFEHDASLPLPTRWASPEPMWHLGDWTPEGPAQYPWAFGPSRLQLTVPSPRPGEQVTWSLRAWTLNDPLPVPTEQGHAMAPGNQVDLRQLSGVHRVVAATLNASPGGEPVAKPVVLRTDVAEAPWTRASISWRMQSGHTWKLSSQGVTLLRAGPEAVSVGPDEPFLVVVAASRPAIDAIRGGGGSLALYVELEGPTERGTLMAIGAEAVFDPNLRSLRVPLDPPTQGPDAWFGAVEVRAAEITGKPRIRFRVQWVDSGGNEQDITTRGEVTPLSTDSTARRSSWTHVAVLAEHQGRQRIAAWGLDPRRAWTPSLEGDELRWVHNGQVAIREYESGHRYAIMTITPEGSRSESPFV